MKMPKGSLTRLICKQFDCVPDDDTYYEIFAHTMSYLTNGISHGEYQSRLKPFCVDKELSAQRFRLLLHKTEYLSLVLRVYILRLAKTRGLKPEQAKEFAQGYGMFNADARRIYDFWEDQPKFRARLREECKQFEIDSHLNLTVLRNTLNYLMGQMEKTVRRRVKKKLSFLMASQNYEVGDFATELNIELVNVFYNKMPTTMTPDHVLNYLRATLESRITNIIKANTTQKRGRLASNKDGAGGFKSATLVCVSENQMGLTATGEPVSLADLASVDPMREVEGEHTVQKILSTVKAGGKNHRFLTILMGVDDAPFTKWLQVSDHCKPSETNSDLQERLAPEQFNILVAQFLRVSNDQVSRFFGKLRGCLEPQQAMLRSA